MSESTELRDAMARYRTVLANERTFLSYTRTALGVVALALFAFKFAPAMWNLILGSCILILAIGVWSLGLYRYRLAESNIKSGAHPPEIE